MRKYSLVNNCYYHILNKSIAGYAIFNTDYDYQRFVNLLQYYQLAEPPISYSRFIKFTLGEQKEILSKNNSSNKLNKIVSYCLMPTHFHLVLEQLEDGGISKYIANICNSYTRYFNLKHDRRGPLWQGRFKNILVGSDEQLLHLTRYIHLNSATNDLVKKPEDWKFSSYSEYISSNIKNNICDFDKILKINPKRYQRFVNGRIMYQRELSKIKKLILE
jgi:putative transposase